MKTWSLGDGIPTWVHESFVAFLILSAVPLLTEAPWFEWFGVAAVWFSFLHASVADRLSEAERLRAKRKGSLSELPFRVHCWEKERRYFLVKEFFWLIYFVALEAWSALVGVGLFLAYRGWRSYYRTYIKPLEGR